MQLTVYDILGREAAVLVDDDRPIGPYESWLDGSGLAAGLYIVQIRAGTFTATQRMVLIR